MTRVEGPLVLAHSKMAYEITNAMAHICTPWNSVGKHPTVVVSQENTSPQTCDLRASRMVVFAVTWVGIAPQARFAITGDPITFFCSQLWLCIGLGTRTPSQTSLYT